MRNLSILTAFVLLMAMAAAGCSNNEAVAKAHAETEAARKEAAAARAEADKALAELARLTGKKPLLKNRPSQEDTPLTKKFLDLHAAFQKNAVSLQEWSGLKRNILDTIPAKASPQEEPTLGKRLLELKKAYDQNAVSLQEWSQAKTKVIAQEPVKKSILNQELLDLKEAYDGSAISLQEWTRAKAEITKRLNGN